MSQTTPQYQAPMAPQYPPPPQKRGGSGCLIGCLIVIVILFILMVVGAVAVYYVGTDFLLNNFTETEPMELPQTQLDPADQADLQTRVEEFEQAMRGEAEVTQLELTGDEVNALLQQFASETPFAGNVHVTVEGDSLGGQISMPLSELVPFDLEEERYINGRALFDFSIVNGRPVLFLKALEVKGQPVPDMMMQELSHENILQDWRPSPEEQAALEQIREVRVRDGKVIVELKEGGATPLQDPAPLEAPGEGESLMEEPAPTIEAEDPPVPETPAAI